MFIVNSINICKDAFNRKMLQGKIRFNLPTYKSVFGNKNVTSIYLLNKDLLLWEIFILFV
jgi:hypothetical protein